MRATKIKKIQNIFFKTIIVNLGCPFKSIREYICFCSKKCNYVAFGEQNKKVANSQNIIRNWS
jgi:hypothetical protein